MLTTTQDKRLAQAREKFGRLFAHEPGTNWKPEPRPLLTRWKEQLRKEKRYGDK